MATTLEALETRLTALEEEMADLRALVASPTAEESAAQRGLRAAAQARRDQPRVQALVAQVFTQMGIPQLPPVPPEQLRAMMAADGVKAEDNLFSRGIMEMREE